jgi:signal transduction histidine kinase
LKLRTKTVLLLLVTTLLLIGTLHTVSYTLLTNSYQQLEQKETTQTVQQVQSQAMSQNAVLDGKLSDWGIWDDAYQFVQDNNTAFREANMVPSSFISIQVNFILFINSYGNYVYGMGYNLTANAEMPVPQSLLTLVQTDPKLWNFHNVNDNLTGVVMLPQGPLILASRPILTSLAQGPIPGTIIFARYFDQRYVASLSSTLRLPLNMTLYNSGEAGMLATYTSTAPSTYVHPLSANKIAGYDVISDINGNQALVLAVTTSRDTYNQGLATQEYVDISVVVASVAFSVAVGLLMEFTVISRLQKLDRNVTRITRDSDSSAKLPVAGDDAIASLSTSINKMLEEIDRKSAQLRQSERFSAIGELATMVAHDLRNPLQGIANAAYYLKRSTMIGEKEKEMLTLIQDDVTYSDKIVGDLLDYSRNIKLELVETNPQKLVGEALSMVSIPERVKLQDETKGEPTLKLDVSKMERVFINIINNAIDAMPDGGSLLMRSNATGHAVDFVFADSGAGMPKEVLERVFTPLFTTKAKGMGFGLSICKRIVEAHGGKITAESVVGKGTTFTISIPTNLDSGKVEAA